MRGCGAGPGLLSTPRPLGPIIAVVPIEILLPTTRTLAGATRAVLEQLEGMTNVDGEEWPKRVPEEISTLELTDVIKADREVVRIRIHVRIGSFLLFPGFVILCRPDDYGDFESDPRARQILGREALELAQAFVSPELIVAGDAASDFLGTEVTTWEGLKDLLVEEDVPHTVIQIPARR